MSNRIRLKRAARVGLVLSVGCAFGVIPALAQASAVNLASVSPFVVLGGSTVTNTGPSVLNGDLGVSPGTSLVGFGLPAVVNGATHDNDAVAGQAQSDLTTAYQVAAGQPVAPADELTGQDLGGLTLTAGAYRYASSAQLTGALTLDAQGDPNAQFVFEIGSTLTTAGASSVVLINGASPCNVFWQVGSSATLGTTTAFQGNLMALTDISLNNGASVIGRVLARNGQVTLINDVLDNSGCTTGPTTGTTSPGGTSGTSATTTPASVVGAGSGALPSTGRTGSPTKAQSKLSTATRKGTATLRRTAHTSREACTAGFRATVRGHLIKRVVFSVDGHVVASQAHSPFRVLVAAAPDQQSISARVTFTDATRAKTLRIGYRACAAAALHPSPGPSPFTG